MGTIGVATTGAGTVVAAVPDPHPAAINKAQLKTIDLQIFLIGIVGLVFKLGILRLLSVSNIRCVALNKWNRFHYTSKKTCVYGMFFTLPI
jgi:hypothetical protein